MIAPVFLIQFKELNCYNRFDQSSQADLAYCAKNLHGMQGVRSSSLLGSKFVAIRLLS